MFLREHQIYVVGSGKLENAILPGNLSFGLCSKMTLRILIISLIALLSCSRVDQKDISSSTIESADTVSYQYKGDFDLADYLATGDIGNINVENIGFNCAILIYPTKEQVEQIKKQEGEANFYRIADDNQWYQALATESIDSAGIETIIVSEKYLRFKGTEKIWELDIRKKDLPAWNVMLFNRDKAPVIVSPVKLTVDDVRNYFDIKE